MQAPEALYSVINRQRRSPSEFWPPRSSTSLRGGIPNRITYPLIMIGVIGLPWLAQPVTGRALLAALLGAVVSGVIGLLNALLADQGLGDVKLAVAVGAWMAHLGLLAWITGLLVAAPDGHRRRKHPEPAPPGRPTTGLHAPRPSLAGGAVLAVAVAGLQ